MKLICEGQRHTNDGSYNPQRFLNPFFNSALTVI